MNVLRSIVFVKGQYDSSFSSIEIYGGMWCFGTGVRTNLKERD